jgi:hypothetical protein
MVTVARFMSVRISPIGDLGEVDISSADSLGIIQIAKELLAMKIA